MPPELSTLYVLSRTVYAVLCFAQVPDRDITIGLKLLWGRQEPPTRGPKPGLTLDRIVRAAIAVADEHGLETVSMRSVAKRLGVGTMSLYRYVPGKSELLDLMLEAALGEEPRGRPRRRPGARSSSTSRARG